MKVLRTTEPDVDKFLVGDIISFELTDGEKVQAMAMKQTDAGMIFILVDCLKDEERMTDLPGKLNTAILDRFPQDIRDKMIPFADGRKLRLPTEKELFGVNEYGADEGDAVQQWGPMKDRRNRIAFQGMGGPWEWYWTETPDKDDDRYFAYVGDDGVANYGNASFSYGVRPAFQI